MELAERLAREKEELQDRVASFSSELAALESRQAERHATEMRLARQQWDAAEGAAREAWAAEQARESRGPRARHPPMPLFACAGRSISRSICCPLCRSWP